VREPEGRTLTDVESTTYARDVDLGGQTGTSPYTEVYQATIDSVVLIRAFSERGISDGSGFFWDERHLVTNQHVVEGGTDVEVQFARGAWTEGEIVETDAYSDLAVVRVEEAAVPDYATPLALVSEDPPIGAEVVALGNPLGLGESVSAGIVSGVDRSLPAPNDFVIADTVQTDAAANPGNSGGPLVTLDGDVVGVVTAGRGNDINFAVSAALMNRVVPTLRAGEEYRHPYVGIRLVGVSPSVAAANDLDEVRGVLVAEVVDDGPSEGVLQGSPDSAVTNGRRVPVGGDVIVEMAGRAIPDREALSTFLALETSPGDTVPTTVIRDGERVEVALELGRRPRPTLAPRLDGPGTLR
jgi:S1-C subfamily serine protease